MNVKELIKATAELSSTETVRKLKKAGLLRECKKSTTEKMEEALFNYPTFKTIKGRKKTTKMTTEIEEALAKVKKDPLYDIIELYYFERMTRSEISVQMGISPNAVTRNKTRLIREMIPIVFSDELIDEILLK